MDAKSIRLEKDCRATMIPAGDEVVLPSGTEVEISQALGGSVTVRARGMLYRIGGRELEALGLEEDQLQDSAAPEVAGEGPLSEDRIWDVLRGCYDPEIPINIVDLGLIYDLQIRDVGKDENVVHVKMTLTAQGCGMGPVIAEDARTRIEALPQVNSAVVDVVWDPPWTPHMISPEGRKRLGL